MNLTVKQQKTISDIQQQCNSTLSLEPPVIAPQTADQQRTGAVSVIVGPKAGKGAFSVWPDGTITQQNKFESDLTFSSISPEAHEQEETPEELIESQADLVESCLQHEHWFAFKDKAVRAAFDELENIDRANASARKFFDGAEISDEERRQKQDEVMEQIIEYSAAYTAVLRTAELAYQAIYDLDQPRDIWDQDSQSVNNLAKSAHSATLQKDLSFEDAYLEVSGT